MRKFFVPDESIKHPISEYVRRLRLFDEASNGFLETTLITWIQNKFNANATADELKVHRNTCRYRIDILSERIGLNIRKVDNVLPLYMELIKN